MKYIDLITKEATLSNLPRSLFELADLLKAADIPFAFSATWRMTMNDACRPERVLEAFIGCPATEDACVVSAVSHKHSYGGDEGLVEVWNRESDDNKGWLDAAHAFSMIEMWWKTKTDDEQTELRGMRANALPEHCQIDRMFEAHEEGERFSQPSPVTHATTKSMFSIHNYSVVTKSLTEVVLFSSAMMEKLESLGYAEDGIIKVSSALEMELSDEDKAIAQSHLQHIVAAGLTLNGVTYVPFFAGSSDIRKGASAWIREDLHAEIGKWAMCGLSTKNMKIAVNKYAAYIGLLMSSTRTFMQVYGRELSVRRVCVVKDSTASVTGPADFVQGTNVTRKDEHTSENNAFDGAAYIRPEITGGKASTLRAPWVKAMAIPMDFIGYAEEHGLSTVIKDYWGNDVDLRDIDLILTESCFKMVGQYESFQQYQEAFEALGHEIRVCVEEHAPRKKAMPYQQLQTLVGGTVVDAKRLMHVTKAALDDYRSPTKAGKLVGGNIAKATQLYPELLAEPYIAGAIAEAYTAKRTRAIGGKVLDLGYNAFLAPDPVAMLEALYGLPICGSLSAGQCYCSNVARKADLGALPYVDVTRSPHLDHAHVILWNVSQPSKYMMGPTMYLNIWDFTTIRLRADYDGDHVWYSDHTALLDVVRKTDKLLGNLPVDWVAPKASKSAINRATLAQFFTGLTQTSQIGIYADNFTRFWAWLTTELDKETITTEEAREVWCWLTYAGNVLIDAAKHGSANVRPPKRVQEFSRMPLPAFCEYAKADSIHPVGDEYWFSKCSQTDGFGDLYSRAVRDTVDETLHIAGIEEMIFDPTELMIDPHRRRGNLEGLCKKGVRIDDGDSKFHYEGEGFFQHLAFASARELEALRENVENDSHKLESWEAERGRIAFEQIKRWAEERGETIEAAYDVITRQIFSNAKNDTVDYQHAVKRAYWSFFGPMVVDVLRSRMDVFDADLILPDVDDELEDVDE